MSNYQKKCVRLAYGRYGLDVNVPEWARVVEPEFVPAVADEGQALHDALNQPVAGPKLADIAGPGKRVCIVHTDITRATPNDRILPPILQTLEAAGVKREDITLLNALGTHRPQTHDELVEMLGQDIVANYRCLQHEAQDDLQLVHVGKTSFGHDVRVNRHYVEADVRILTGFIEPHFFAGYSGGPKGVLPSIAGAESVLDNHGARMIGDPNATFGRTEGNPIWQEMREAALMAEPSFIVNVTLNKDKRITGVFAGEMEEAHKAGCEFVKESAMVPVDEPFDIVLTTNSGYPLDLNLYQTVKGMAAAALVTREGGDIILAAQCWDGVPDHGAFGKLLREAESPRQLLERVESPGFASADQWQVQIQARIQLKANVHLHAEGLSEDEIRDCLLKPVADIEATIDRLVDQRGGRCRVCVMPEGPVTVPYLSA